MGEKRYTVGEVSRITGVSKDTLRFYDKIDLFKPSFVDSQNGYRYYTYDQFWKIDIIVCCRKLNIPTQKIREILSSEDNDIVVKLMKEHQKAALNLSDYFKRVAEDIEWYVEQHRQICQAELQSAVTVKQLPQKTVIYGKNTEDARAYHLKLQEICRDAVNYNDSIRRSYGFILDHSRIGENKFIKQGEYIELGNNTYEEIDTRHFITLPAGHYACYMVKVVQDYADFTVLNQWLSANKVSPQFVIADEAGLQLFEYLEHGYPCEVKVYLEENIKTGLTL